MCFSISMSVSMIVAGVILASFSPRGMIRFEVLYVLLMEVLQLIGILVADDCSHPLNAPVTWLSLIHISLQPWLYQEWQFSLTELRGVFVFSSQHKRLVRGLAAAFASKALHCFAQPIMLT